LSYASSSRRGCGGRLCMSIPAAHLEKNNIGLRRAPTPCGLDSGSTVFSEYARAWISCPRPSQCAHHALAREYVHSLFGARQCGCYLRKKPLECAAWIYTDSENSLARQARAALHLLLFAQWNSSHRACLPMVRQPGQATRRGGAVFPEMP